MDGEERAIEEVPQLVSGVAEALDFLLRPFPCRQARVLGHRFSDRGVETPVEV